jgi:hypothetical protein
MSKKMITPRNGEPFEVDTSDKACSRFGVKHGQRIKDCDGDEGVVEGVAPATEGLRLEPKVLWYTLDRDAGESCYMFPFEEGDLTPI